MPFKVGQTLKPDLNHHSVVCAQTFASSLRLCFSGHENDLVFTAGPLFCLQAITANSAQTSAKASTPATSPGPVRHFYVKQYLVKGGDHLISHLEIEEAVYPYLGPARTAQDVDDARAALERAYRAKGYQTVAVQIPAQKVDSGIIVLQVMPNPVGRLRIHGSRYYSLEEIRREAPSLAEGTVPNFSQVTRDLTVLNSSPDRAVTPALKAGAVPGTVDIDLTVKDKPPIHGSLELNNRYRPVHTRNCGSTARSVTTICGNWGTAWASASSFPPQEINQVQVFSGYYSAKIPDIDWLTLLVQGTDQGQQRLDVGRHRCRGQGADGRLRAIISLPPQSNFYHSISLGVDYKHFEQGLNIAGEVTNTPVTYYPFSAAYSGTWLGTGYETDMNASVTLDVRGIGSGETEFDDNRHGADASFLYLRGDLSHTRDLPQGFQIYGKIQAQVADKPLVNSEQFSEGGIGTVRGYLESEELG